MNGPMTPKGEERSGVGALINMMVRRPVAANLVMLIMLLGGAAAFPFVPQDIFPESDPDTVTVRVSYPGADPEETERALLTPLENAVRGVDGLKNMTSKAEEGSATLTVEVEDAADVMRAAQDVQAATDRIASFPLDAERPKVSVNSRRRNVLDLALYGDVPETVLRAAASRVLSVLESHPETGAATLQGAKNAEIHVEIPLDRLRRHGLTISAVAAKIAASTRESGGGKLETTGGEILLHAGHRPETARALASVPLLTDASGGTLLLGQVAEIREGFEDTPAEARVNGKPAVLFDISRTEGLTPVGVSEAVKALLPELTRGLPAGVNLEITRDRSDVFKQRAQLMLNDGVAGFIMVTLCLALFLEPRLAFWVATGIPVSFLGAFLLLSVTDFSVNMISMFAFMIGTGIVVDDAIVFGENIFRKREQGLGPLDAAVAGASELAAPIIVSALTNMAAFVPIAFIPGMVGKTYGCIPAVVIAVFFVSMIESCFVLPAHLTFKESRISGGVMGRVASWHRRFNDAFDRFIRGAYANGLRAVLRARYVAVCLFFGVMLAGGGYVAGGHMGMQLFPRVEADFAFASAELAPGSPLATVNAARDRLIETARKVAAEHGGDRLVTAVLSQIKGDTVEVRAQLTDPETRPLSTKAFSEAWRKLAGAVPGARAVTFQSDKGGPGSGAALTVELRHDDAEVSAAAARDLAAALKQFPQVSDVDDGSARGKRQMTRELTPLGAAVGLTSDDVGRQMRAAFFGAEAARFQRGRDEVRVLVRLPESERASVGSASALLLRAPSGAEIPLDEAAAPTEGRAFTAIQRRDGMRAVTVKADVTPTQDAGKIIRALNDDTFPELKRRYPGLTYEYEGAQAELRDSMHTLKYGAYGVLFLIYALLAVSFNSWSQPLMILAAVPFSAAGAIIGHSIMGYPLSVISLFGILALAGVTVNQSMILVDFANRNQAEDEGLDSSEVIVRACAERFRPIMLTTLTTFVGLAPIMFETSRQAKFLIPMAISLGFGVLFATIITLSVVPAMYRIIEDLRPKAAGKLAKGDGV